MRVDNPYVRTPGSKFFTFMFVVFLALMAFMFGVLAYSIATNDSVLPEDKINSGDCSEILEGIKESGNDAGMAEYGRIKYQENC